MIYLVHLAPDEEKILISRQLIKPKWMESVSSISRSTSRDVISSKMTIANRSASDVSLTEAKHTKYMSPKFYAVPHSRVAEEGETVQFQCAIAGHPTPSFTWSKDNVTVTQTPRITITKRDDLRILQIVKVTPEDAGLYRIAIENEHGKQSFFDQILKDFLFNDDNLILIGRVEAAARLDVIGSGRGVSHGIRTGSSPRRSLGVSRRLMASSTRIGGCLKLSVNFDGAPIPSRRFYRNGIAVNLNDPRIVVQMDDHKANINIGNAQSKDEGTYTCIAENMLGIAASSTYVTLFQDESEIVKQAPEFVRALESIDVLESEHSIDLRCQVQSFTPFDVQWKYNSKMIEFDTNKFRYDLFFYINFILT